MQLHRSFARLTIKANTSMVRASALICSALSLDNNVTAIFSAALPCMLREGISLSITYFTLGPIVPLVIVDYS